MNIDELRKMDLTIGEKIEILVRKPKEKERLPHPYGHFIVYYQQLLEYHPIRNVPTLVYSRGLPLDRRLEANGLGPNIPVDQIERVTILYSKIDALKLLGERSHI